MMILVFLIAGALHPFHLSVTNIYFKPNEKVVQVEQRIFLDDFEEALKDYTDDIYFNITEGDKDKVKKILTEYLNENFYIMSKDKKIPLEYLGNEIDLAENVMWVYWEAEKVRKLESFRVTNKLLIEKFPDQENIIHYISPNGDKKSERTLDGKSSIQF